MVTSFIKTANTLTLILNGVPHTVTADHPKFKQALNLVKKNLIEKAVSLINPTQHIKKVKNVSIKNGRVYYGDQVLHHVVTQRIVDYIENNLPHQPLVNFLEKLMKNTDERVRELLYPFLEHKSVVISDNGNFLCFKSVRPDYTDWYSGKFSNKIGETVIEDKDKCDPNPDVHCSSGLHCAALDYALNFNNSDGRHLMVVEVDPADVVSVPRDSNGQKIRAWRYRVVAEMINGKALTKPVYKVQKNGKGLVGYKPLRDAKGRFVSA